MSKFGKLLRIESKKSNGQNKNSRNFFEGSSGGYARDLQAVNREIDEIVDSIKRIQKPGFEEASSGESHSDESEIEIIGISAANSEELEIISVSDANSKESEIKITGIYSKKSSHEKIHVYEGQEETEKLLKDRLKRAIRKIKQVDPEGKTEQAKLEAQQATDKSIKEVLVPFFDGEDDKLRELIGAIKERLSYHVDLKAVSSMREDAREEEKFEHFSNEFSKTSHSSLSSFASGEVRLNRQKTAGSLSKYRKGEAQAQARAQAQEKLADAVVGTLGIDSADVISLGGNSFRLPVGTEVNALMRFGYEVANASPANCIKITISAPEALKEEYRRLHQQKNGFERAS